MFNVDMTPVREKILFLITTRSTGQVVSIRDRAETEVGRLEKYISLIKFP